MGLKLFMFSTVHCFFKGMVLACFGFALAFSCSAARAENMTWVGALFQQCMKMPGPRYVAWVPEAYHYCLWNWQSDPEEGVRRAIENCNNDLPRNLKRAKVTCVPGFDGKKIVDPRLKTSLGRLLPVPVNMRIHDGVTGTTQPGKAVIYRTATADPFETTIRVVADGISICTGSYTMQVNVYRGEFTVECFGERFSGTTTGLSLLRAGDYFLLMPPKIRVESEGSYIEFFI